MSRFVSRVALVSVSEALGPRPDLSPELAPDSLPNKFMLKTLFGVIAPVSYKYRHATFFLIWQFAKQIFLLAI